jgi:hypothetical protein
MGAIKIIFKICKFKEMKLAVIETSMFPAKSRNRESVYSTSNYNKWFWCFLEFFFGNPCK